MAERNWKERVMFHKKHELEKRGVSLAKDEKEAKERRKEAGERGGIVFVSKDAEKAFKGDN